MGNLVLDIEVIVSDEIRNQQMLCPVAVAIKAGMTEFMEKIYAQETWLGGFDNEVPPERVVSPYTAANGVVFKFNTRSKRHGLVGMLFKLIGWSGKQ